MDDTQKLREQLARKASQMIVGGFRPSTDPFASWFGRVQVALPTEEWPKIGDTPMMALCQINCAELPYKPEILADIAFITIFISPDEWPDRTPNGSDWLLRTYSTLEGLVQVQEPSTSGTIKPLPIRWKLIEEDYPCWDDVPYSVQRELLGREPGSWGDVPDNDFLAALKRYTDLFKHRHCSKIGGWPSYIQAEASSFFGKDFEYVLQIDSEYDAQWNWGDSGTACLGYAPKNQRDHWALYWDCY